MNRRTHFVSLNFKLALVVVLALLATLVVFLLVNAVEDAVVERVYLSESAVESQINEAYDELIKTINRYDVKSTDTERLQSWIRDHNYTHLTVYDNNTISFEGGWLYSPTAPEGTESTVTEEKNEVSYDEAEERITPSEFNEDLKNRIVEFADGPYYVFVDVFREQHLYRIMLFVRLILCAATLIGIVVVYNAHVIRRVIKLSQLVQTVSDGDLDAEIEATSNDEIGSLADNVDTMRDSIVERLQNEKEAWDANTQLITAMSHDIRTPLTSLIGYLDIIQGEKYQSKGEMEKYIDSCREKAFQLKELSDKLFQYFLVFGSKEEKELDVFNAGILLQQIISEHSAELMSYGYNIDFDYRVPDVEIQADISGMRRLFDNLSSNIMKYADKDAHVRISAAVENDEIIIRIINRIQESPYKVESNNIGVKTCEKICKDMGGTFIYKDEGQVYTTRMTFPIYSDPSAKDSEGSDDSAAKDMASSMPLTS